MDYGDTPAIAPGTPKGLEVQVRNTRADDVTLEVLMTGPARWSVDPDGPRRLELPPDATTTLHYTLRVDDPAAVRNRNQALLTIQPHGRPAEAALPVVLTGARRWLVWGPRAETGDAGALLNRAYEAEERLSREGMDRPRDGWRVAHAGDNALPAEIGTAWTGVLYTRLFLHSPRRQEVRLGVPATCPRRLWLNGRQIHEVREPTLLRPNYGGDGVSYVDTTLEEGWNDVLVKYARDAACPPFAAHLTLATIGLYDGVVDVRWTCVPWDTNGE